MKKHEKLTGRARVRREGRGARLLACALCAALLLTLLPPSAAAAVATIDITKKPGSTLVVNQPFDIEAFVKDENEDPIAVGVTLALSIYSDDGATLSGTLEQGTDDSGEAAWEGLKFTTSGTAVLVVSEKGEMAKAQTEEITIKAHGEPHTLAFCDISTQIQSNEIVTRSFPVATLTDAWGNPVPGKDIQFTLDSGTPETYTTDADGVIIISIDTEPLRGGDHTLSIALEENENISDEYTLRRYTLHTVTIDYKEGSDSVGTQVLAESREMDDTIAPQDLTPPDGYRLDPAFEGVTVPEGYKPLAPITLEVPVVEGTRAVELSPSGDKAFPAAAKGYASLTPHGVTATNTGDYELNLNMSLTGANASSFTLSHDELALAVGKSEKFTVVPNDGLAAGSYTATVHVEEEGIDKTFGVSFTVTEGPPRTVSYEKGGATGDLPPEGGPYQDGDTVTVPGNPGGLTLDGYSFAGWMHGGDGKLYRQGETFKIDGDVTLTAHWSQAVEAEEKPEKTSPLPRTKDAVVAFDRDYADLGRVLLNGKELEKVPVSEKKAHLTGWAGYRGNVGEVEEGSVVVTLYKDFLNSLPAGTYKLVAEFAETTPNVTGLGTLDFTLAKKSKPSDDTPYFARFTLTHPGTGVTVYGRFVDDRPFLMVGSDRLHNEGICDACDTIRYHIGRGELLVLYDIAASEDSEGDLTVSIPVGTQYDGQSVTILHCAGRKLEKARATVRNGYAGGDFSSLSPFAVIRELPDVVITGLPDSHAMWLGGSVGWAPTPSGGAWSYDSSYLSLSQANGVTTFTAWRTGTTAVSYTVGDVTRTVWVTINGATLPQTGEPGGGPATLSLLWVAGLGAAALYKRRKRHAD